MKFWRQRTWSGVVLEKLFLCFQDISFFYFNVLPVLMQKNCRNTVDIQYKGIDKKQIDNNSKVIKKLKVLESSLQIVNELAVFFDLSKSRIEQSFAMCCNSLNPTTTEQKQLIKEFIDDVQMTEIYHNYNLYYDNQILISTKFCF
ncbi:unnamed protein product [Paramecium sonneborni]|uniref:Uncharacterized protein n=1 Tax=Paramecium sonneborni TaxID=65129 RepID=A0A8S1R587_9CILI|nr:unnamed protein product [Paramecium sonneborni]